MADVEEAPASSQGSTSAVAAPPPSRPAAPLPAPLPAPPPPPGRPRRHGGAVAALALWARAFLDPSDEGGLNGFVSWPGALSLVGAAWLMLLARAADGEARALAGALCLDSLADAASAAADRDSSSRPPLLVALRGRVGASNPRPCELDPSARAVILELVEEDIYLARGATGGLVRAPFETRRELAEREWWVEELDGSGARVRVEGGRGAARLADALEVRQEYRERQEVGLVPAGQPAPSSQPPDPSPSSSPPPPLPLPAPPPHHHHHHHHPPAGVGVVQATLGWTLGQLFVGQRHQGTRKTERFLPVGAIVTVVGELARLGGGGSRGAAAAATASSSSTSAPHLPPPPPSLVVRRPPPGPSGAAPFYVTSLSPRQLHAALAANARACRALAACLGAVGCALVARKAARGLWLQHRQRQARLRVLRAEAERERRLQQAAAAERKAERRRRRRLERRRQQGQRDDAAAASAAGSAAGGGRGGGGGAESGSDDDSDDDDDSEDDDDDEAAAAYGGRGNLDKRRGGVGGDDEVGVCVVCLSNSSSMVFVRCGHLCACAGCAGSLNRCPLCRAPSHAIRVYRT